MLDNSLKRRAKVFVFIPSTDADANLPFLTNLLLRVKSTSKFNGGHFSFSERCFLI